MNEDKLPFGVTETTGKGIRAATDRETAIAELRSADVPSPQSAVDSFLEKVPDLLAWLEDHGRDYPWRWTTDPWRIYATEILLQRTRSDAVAELYDEFFKKFSEPHAILVADESDIREVVRPLGFVNHRVRALREAAELCEKYDGTVPEDRDALQEPWRVGPYTARACLVFAFDEPVAIVDTNTARILSRVFKYPLPKQPHKSDRVYRLLDALTPDSPGLARAFNLALLDLGALVCTHDSPNCASCPLFGGCRYAAENYG